MAFSSNNQNGYDGLDPETFGSEARGKAQRVYANAGAVDNGLAFGGRSAETMNQFAVKTFGWMFAGLLLTFGIAYAFCASGLYLTMYQAMPLLPFVLMIGEVILVLVLSARLNRMSVGAARGMFFAYAALNGVTFSYVFAIYLTTTVLFVFAMAALYFGALAAYGWLTKRDLTRLAPILLTGLIVLIAFSLLSLLFRFSGMEMIACFVGLAIFMGFTAYDTQKMKHIYASTSGNNALAQKASIYMALTLYLDFINLFLYLLRLMGNRSRD